MSKQAYIFPGQGSQFSGMGQSLYNNHATAQSLFHQANEILGFNITDIMFHGTDEALKQTNVTQPAIFLHSVIAYETIENSKPDMVAGHSLGEFSALYANRTLRFEDALRLVSIRAQAMQKACEENPSTMAAVLGLGDEQVTTICAEVSKSSTEIVVAANYNCPGQVVISGTLKGIELAGEALKNAGAKRVVMLPVGGAFHSPLMESAKKELEAAIQQTFFFNPVCPIYQNVTAKAVIDPKVIKENLVNQLTGPVKWTQTINTMINDGADSFIEVGPGNVLQGLVKKINKEMLTAGIAG